ncbi:unnamed protein product [Musa acuminata var. zebrina]
MADSYLALRSRPSLLLVLLVLLCFSLSVATASDPDATVTVGGISDAEGAPNALLEFARVVKAREQMVVGTLHHLTIEVIDAGKKKIYEAKVWIKPWLNFKELQEFRHAGDS